MQEITVDGDDEAPVLVGVPTDATFECSSLPPFVDPVTATDNCDANVVITFTETSIPGLCADTYTISREWIATDACGNSTAATQTVEVEDTTVPVLSGIPSDLNINCCLLYTSPSPRDKRQSRMPSSA